MEIIPITTPPCKSYSRPHPSPHAVVKLLSKRWWIPAGARLEGPKLESKVPRAQVVLLTADQGFSSIQGILLGFYSI